jgi:hypothetical protein
LIIRKSRQPRTAERCLGRIALLLSNARTTALAPVPARCGCFGCRGSSPTDARKLREPLRSGKYGEEETGYAQVEIEAFEVQAAASTKDLDRADQSMFPGTAEYVALSFKTLGHESGFFWQVSGCISISLITFLYVPETRWSSQMGRA